jgi:hypothetical protein
LFRGRKSSAWKLLVNPVIASDETMVPGAELSKVTRLLVSSMPNTVAALAPVDSNRAESPPSSSLFMDNSPDVVMAGSRASQPPAVRRG